MFCAYCVNVILISVIFLLYYVIEIQVGLKWFYFEQKSNRQYIIENKQTTNSVNVFSIIVPRPSLICAITDFLTFFKIYQLNVFSVI